jgi:hypothetical protein
LGLIKSDGQGINLAMTVDKLLGHNQTALCDIAAFRRWADSEGYFHVVLRPGTELWYGVKRLMFHYTVIEGEINDREAYRQRWCYQTAYAGIIALETWAASRFEGIEPKGWHRHPSTGRRRPDGDAKQEHVAW